MIKMRTILGTTLIMLLALSAGLMAGTYSGGSGTEGAPYQITTTADLIELSNTSGDWDKYFTQTANIAFDATEANVDWDNSGSNGPAEGFSPIGNGTTQFTGNYNGGDYTIDNLYINRSSTNHIGLFGWTVGATINNIGVTNVDITSDGGNNIGGLVGYNTSSSTVSNSYSAGSVTDNSTQWWVGGLVGNNDNSTVRNSYSRCSVTGYSNVGGLVGRAYSATVENSYSTGSVSGTGKTTAEMKTLSTFTAAGWDFSSIWDRAVNTNSGYPFINTASHVTISGTSGFRMMSSPLAGQIYSDLLSELFTQGMTGGDVTTGTANVWTLDVANQTWSALTDISASGNSQTAGQGFLVCQYR